MVEADSPVVGAFEMDPCWSTEGTVSLRGGLSEPDLADHVQVSLYIQSIPPFYLQERFQDAARGSGAKEDIERLYYLTSHLNLDGNE